MVTKKYRELIEHFPLVPIKNDANLDKAHAVAQSLMLRKKPMDSDEKQYLEVLLNQILKYEKKHYPLWVDEV
jgi:antitoxin component HigA of HigAB toxin-antitoxin module